MYYPHTLTVAFATFALVAILLCLPRNRQAWLLALLAIAVAILVNVWLKL
jgi:hypothetical protein